RIEDGTRMARPRDLTPAPAAPDGLCGAASPRSASGSFMALRPYRAYRGFKEKGARSDVIPAQPAAERKPPANPEIFEERPKVLSPFVAVEREAPEVVEQDGGGDHVEHEQQRRLAAIKIEQNAHRAEDLEHAAEHQQHHGERRRQRDQTVAGLRHGRLVIENLVERAERKDEHQTQSGDEVEDLVLLALGSLRPGGLSQKVFCRFSLAQP